MSFDFTVLVGQMKILATLMLVGVCWQKAKIFSNELINSFSAVIARLILPLMLCTVVGSVSKSDIAQGIRVFLVTAFFYTLIVVLALIFSKIGKGDRARRKMDVLLECYGNSGFIGIPLLVSIFPEKAGIVAAAYTIVDVFFYWVVGPCIVGESKKINFRKLITPITVSVAAGIVFMFLPDIVKNNIVWDTAYNVGATCKYFASIYIGMSIARMDGARLKSNMRSFAAAPVKLIIIPLLACFIVGKTGLLSGDVLTMFIILCSTPAGMMLPIIAEYAEADTGEYASVGLTFSTVLCLITMPLMMWIIGKI